MPDDVAPSNRAEAISNTWTWILPAHAKALGFSVNTAGAHLARSMMLNELTRLLQSTSSTATTDQYRHAIVEENLLGKPTYSSRLNTFKHLSDLYSLDGSLTLFRLLRRFATDEPASLPQLALICSFCRDPQLRESFRLIERLTSGEELPRQRMVDHLETLYPSRYSASMKTTLAQHVNTTWSKSGHLSGRTKKFRQMPKPTLTGTVYAMLAGYLLGQRGTVLTGGLMSKLVGTNSLQAISMLQAGGSRNWCRVRHGGDVLQIDFSLLLSPHEQELIHGET